MAKSQRKSKLSNASSKRASRPRVAASVAKKKRSGPRSSSPGGGATASLKPAGKTPTHGSSPSRRITENGKLEPWWLAGKKLDWDQLTDDQLLDCRMCDLPLDLEKSSLVGKIERLYEEMAARGLDFKPHFWLSDEWFAPDGIPGIAIPFYLAHPRLCQLERKLMLEVEGGSDEWCMKILRHETGHVLDTAFLLHRRKRYREVFGSYSDPYPEYYRPHPKSRRYVVHLEPWYAQSHPAEDFAETFAVWLKPGGRWRTQYRGWPALKKLEYVDELMGSIVGAKPKVVSRKTIEPLRQIKRTLRDHYEQRRARYEMDLPSPFDRDLLRLFFSEKNDESALKEVRRQESKLHDFVEQQASALLRKHKTEIERQVTSWTGENRYTVSLVVREVIDRCRELKLRAIGSEARLVRDVTIFITVQTMNYLHSGLHRVAL
ncbi:MAG: putative zinc-binding metallopeptidase [Planctomycetaceae bacterium]|nr:putative zinc-binding metallopeptidase [Planctomycetaceae bacterium]